MSVLLTELAADARRAIEDAERAGITIDDGNVVDLLADRHPSLSLRTLRHALVSAGLAKRFPRATRAVAP